MKERPLSLEEIRQFESRGFVILRQAFSREVATTVRSILINRLNQPDLAINVNKEKTWVDRQGIPEIYGKGRRDAPWDRVLTDRHFHAIDQLCGKHRWKEFGCGWWVITFPNRAQGPWGPAGKWHIDGFHYRHRINSKESGLIPIFLFNDLLQPGAGGTALMVGSHKIAARILMKYHPGELSGRELSLKTLAQVQSSHGFVIEEIQGQAGDVVLMHPFLLHARSKNLGTHGKASIRFMCSPNIELNGPLRLPVTKMDHKLACCLPSKGQ